MRLKEGEHINFKQMTEVFGEALIAEPISGEDKVVYIIIGQPPRYL
jgi:hypothetical protein